MEKEEGVDPSPPPPPPGLFQHSKKSLGSRTPPPLNLGEGARVLSLSLFKNVFFNLKETLGFFSGAKCRKKTKKCN